MKKSLFVFVLLIATSLALTACGGGGPSTTIDVTFTDFLFTPDSFTISAGQQITVNATNNGAVAHEFVIMKFGQSIGDDFGPEDEGNIYWEIQAEPGAKNAGTFTAPTDPGEYQVVCGTPGHFKAGMVGKLIVVAP